MPLSRSIVKTISADKMSNNKSNSYNNPNLKIDSDKKSSVASILISNRRAALKKMSKQIAGEIMATLYRRNMIIPKINGSLQAVKSKHLVQTNL